MTPAPVSISTHRATPRGRRAFTLIELISVIVVLSILAATAAPALSSMQRGREVALVREADRRVELAAATALSTTLPTGVRFDSASQTMTLVEITSSGAAPTELRATVGATHAELQVGTIFPGTSIATVDLADAGSPDTIWFDYEAAPQTRNADGTNPVALTRNAVITFASGDTLTIHQTTGLIERGTP